MSTFSIVLTLVGLFSFYMFLVWLDAKKNWYFVDWFNGLTNNPFKKYADTASRSNIISNSISAANNSELSAKDKQIAELTERVSVLEKIVTEPAYELNKKLSQL